MLRRQALMADMLSHVSLAGVAGGAYLHIDPTLTGFVVAVLGAIAVEYVRRSYKTYMKYPLLLSWLAVCLSAVVLMSLDQSINKGFTSYLFGLVVAVTKAELLLMI